MTESPRPATWQRAALWAGLAVAVLVPRAFLLATYPLHEFEAMSLDILDEGLVPLHAPLPSIFAVAWDSLGGLFGVGFTPWWLRLPNLALAGAAAWLLVRIGQMARVPMAGVGAALLFAAMPGNLLLSLPQEHYFIESVATLWFLERLQWTFTAERPPPPSLFVAAALCLWTGYVTALVVGPGLVGLGVVAHRRGELRSLVRPLALTAAACLPVVIHAAWGLLAHLGHADVGVLEEMSSERGVGGGRLLPFLPGLLDGIVGAEVPAWALVVLLPAIPAAIYLPLGRVIFAAVAVTAVSGVFVQWVPLNTAFLWSPLALVSFLGLGALARGARVLEGGLVVLLLGGFLFLAWGPGGADLADNDTVPYLGTAEIARAVSESAHEELVFLYNGNEVTPLLHELCRPTSWRDYLACTEGLSLDHPKGWAVLSGAVAGRRLYALKPWGGAGPDEQLDLLDQMAAGWGVRARPHAFLVTRGRRASFGDRPAWTATDCVPGTETRGFILYECSGGVGAPRGSGHPPR